MGWKSVWSCFLLLSITTVAEVQARLVRNHVSSICSTWGREHFKTFDGDVYQFPGTCEYNLVSDCHETFQEFSVHMKRDNNDGNPTVSYVVVTINDMSFHLTSSLVSVNDEVVALPYFKAGVLVEKNAVYIKLQSKVGITVMWNSQDSVMVEVDHDYANRTCGLCGDFNGVPVFNEFIHDDRRVTPIEFGNHHKVHRPNDDCEDPNEEEDESSEAVTMPESCKEFQTKCEKLLHSKSWSSCTSQIDPGPYIQACVQDMCSCKDDTKDQCVCSTLSEFSRQCSHAGGQPPSWRTTEFCAVQCPYNMVYEESGSPCMDTCTYQDTSSLCEDHKMDGCFCPPGTVFDDISKRGCIAQSKCQCKHDKVYDSGEVYRQDREECTCVGGRWSCESLETPAVCAVEEGSHVTTFDGKLYTFHGDCYYTVAKVDSKDGKSPKFTVLAQLMPCAHEEFDTCLKTVKVLLNNDKNNVLSFTPDGKVKQNMQTITMPYRSGDISIFHASSFHIILQTSFGMQIQIQHVPIMQVYIKLDPSYRQKTRGLCGNYNMILSDDMKTPQGIVEGTAATFANSWKANQMCTDREERLDDPCAFSVENERYAKHWCALLLSNNSTFTPCRSAVDPEIYYKRCTYATCNCEKSEACLCGVFSSYARACAAKGVMLADWKDTVCDKYMNNCPASQAFSYNHQKCQMTCRSLALNQQTCISDLSPVDGCSCAEGSYLDDSGLCVPMSKCPCYHNDVYIKPGKAVSIKNERCVCTNGVLHCHSWTARSSACPSPKVFFNCSSPGAIGLQCARTCSNLDGDDCDSTECESGCRCPDGLLEDGKGSCVRESDCTCQHDGRLFVPGTKIPNQCNTCTCKSGKWECTTLKCPGTCVIYGSGHHTTFDQKKYGFQGQCSYIAVKNSCGKKEAADNFGIITENVLCGSTGTTCSKTVRVQMGRREIKFSKNRFEEEDLEHGAEVKYRIRRVGLYLVLESDIGVAVMWDRKTSIRILLDPRHSGEVCGLCGNFDGDGQNDFTTQGNLLVSSPLEFANSWKLSSSCPDVETTANTCEVAPNRHHWAKLMCSIIIGKTFKDCHKKVDPIPFYENCVRDTCACDSGGDCECFCTAVAAYAQSCNEADVCVAWRTPDICPIYCDYYNNPEECTWHYYPCHKACYVTCLHPEGICTNPLPNLEGCYPVCPPEKPIYDENNGTCVDVCPLPTTPPPTTTTPYTTTTPITTTTLTTPVVDTTTTPEPTTTTTPPPTTTTPEPPTTTTPPPTTTTPEPPTTTTTPPTTTTPEPPTTTTPPPTTTTPEPPTTTTTPPTTTTPEPPTTTTPPPTTTTPEPPTTTTTPPTTTTPEPPTTTTTPPTTTTPEPPTTTTPPPTTTTPHIDTTTTSPVTPPCLPACEWTGWFDVDTPVGDGSDWETYVNITNSGHTICEKPMEIDCRSSDYPDKPLEDFLESTGQVAYCNKSFGFICRKEDQKRPPRKCFNYKIRVCCDICHPTPPPPSTTTTPPPTTTTPEPPTTTTTTPPTTTTPEPPTTTTTTPPTTTTPEPPTTTTTTPPTTTTPEPPTTTTTTTPPTTTTPEPPTTTTTTTPPTTTTPEPPTTTTTPPTTTTPEPPTTTTTPPTTTTPEPPTTTTTPPTTTTPEPPTTTTTTTPPTTTTPEPPTTTTTPPTTTTPEPPTTTTTPPTTTTPEPPTTTTTTTPPTTTTPEPPTTTTTPPTTTTPEPPTTTTTTTPPTTTTPEPPTTTTTPPTTTTPEPPTTTTTTTPPTTTTPEPPTTTTTTTPPTTTTPEPPTTTTTPPTTTTPEPPTTTTTTTPPTTTTPEPPTTTTTPPTTTTPEPPTTTTTTTPPTTTTPEPPTTTTTPPTTTTPEPPTTTTTTTPPTTTTPEPPTTTTTPPTTTTPEPPTTTTTPPTTTTPEPPTTTTTTTPPTTTTPEPPTTTTTPPTTTTPEPPTTTTTTTPPTTTTPEPPTTTTTPPTTTTPEPPTTTTTTTPPTTTTPEPPTTTTTPPTTTTPEPPTTTTTPPTTTTPEPPTTTTTTTPPTTTTPEPPTTTTTPPTTTTPEPPTTTTTTTPPTTTTPEPPTTTTTPPTTTTPEPPTTTTTTTPPTTTTPEPPTTTTTPPTTTTPEPPTTTTTTTPPTTTTPEPPTTTTTTTPPTTTTPEPPTTTTTTTPPTTTTPEPPTTTTTTTPPTTTTPKPPTTTTTTTPPTTTTPKPTTTTTPPTTTTPTPVPTTTATVPTCPEWNVTQNETFWICECILAMCIEDNIIIIIPYECPPPVEITCTNGQKPVLVWDEDHCCQHYACDCVCEGWGDPHYVTFDGLFYSYQGNCTYVLMEEKIPKYDLKIYIDNVLCDPTEEVSCPRSIIISYKSQVITLYNHNLLGAAQLEALQDGKPLKLPYLNHGIKIIDTGMDLIYELPFLKVVIKFGLTGFMVDLPYQLFGENTQGHCGTCNNNTADDCMLPSGQLLDDCAIMADYWPANDIYQPNCPKPPPPPTSAPKPTPTLAPCDSDSICDLLYKDPFTACHPFVSPDNFYKGCVFDSCHVSNPVVECTSLQTYAAACAQVGVCLYWRNHTKICPSTCPEGKVYKPCGPAEQPTCADNPYEPTMNFTTEGCFCPDGTILFNKDSGICVEKCGCIDPEGVPREFNEEFEYKCQDCICLESTKAVTCKPKSCPTPPIVDCSGPGFVLINQTNPTDACCLVFACQCNANTCPVIETSCDIGYKPSLSVPDGKCCPELTCEPKRVCVHKDSEYQPGASVPAPNCQECTCSNVVEPSTGLFKIECEFVKCDKTCEEGHTYVEPDSDKCCGKCLHTHCVIKVDNTTKLLIQGDTWSPPGNKCLYYSCTKSSGALITISSDVICPPFNESNCYAGTIQTAANGCCKICVEKEKGCKLMSSKNFVSHGNCRSIEMVNMPYCEGSCNTFTMYSMSASTLEHSCSCCKEIRSSSRTIDLLCLNGEKLAYTYTHVEECSCGMKECDKFPAAPARRRRSLM